MSWGSVHAHKALGGGKGDCCWLLAGDKAASWLQELGCGREGRAGPRASVPCLLAPVVRRNCPHRAMLELWGLLPLLPT